MKSRYRHSLGARTSSSACPRRSLFGFSNHTLNHFCGRGRPCSQRKRGSLNQNQFPRRNFLSLAGKGLGLAALSSSTIASLLKEVEAATRSVAHLSPEQAAMDESYWSTIQNSFTVTRGIINLNNGRVSR